MSRWRGIAKRLGRGAALRAYRVHRGVYVFQLARGIGVSCREIHRAEDGAAGFDRTISRSAQWLLDNPTNPRSKGKRE